MIKYHKKILFTSVVIIAFFILLELVLSMILPPLWPQVFHIPSADWLEQECIMISEEIGIELIPERCGIDSQGMWVIDSENRPLRNRRLLLLGDSLSSKLTFGYYVKRMQALFDDFTSEEKWEISTGAVPGYNTYQKLKLLEKNLPVRAAKFSCISTLPGRSMQFY